jgi:transcription-repair coupling factor (superfamily II helicase)
MALSGVRDLSLITTPPSKRLSVKTFVYEWRKEIIREAILRELQRGGQVYFLHNNLDTIEKTAYELQEVVPGIKLAIGHGQMRERQLEKVMNDFYHHRINVLVCTTIIESGIDVPTANTIIINRADKLGLAQLHQLRGRVGRSHHQAYAYLLTPDFKGITEDAKKRLDVIATHEDLGSGYMLANHDLEIRGAGEFLGKDQSGQIQAIGFTLYMELLERAVNSLKAGHVPNFDEALEESTEVDLKVTALIPENFIPDVHTRLIIYKRIANGKDHAALKDLQIELIDRFGLMPEALKNLFAITELKLRCEQLGIKKLESSIKQGKILFAEKPAINPAHLIKLIQLKPARYKLAGQDKLNFFFKDEIKSEHLLESVEDILNELSM